MSEYCSQCTPFENMCDYNLFKIALYLKRGRSESFLCEGCNNRAGYKDEDGNLYLAKLIENNIELFPVKIEELMFI